MVDENETSQEKENDADEEELREVSEEGLTTILDDHKKWLNSEGKEGKQADFHHANLEKRNLKEAILKKAKLLYAKLDHAEFQNAKLQYAFLQNTRARKTNFEGADLFNARCSNGYFYEANFKEAKLQSAHFDNTNLRSADFQGADLPLADLQNAHMHQTVLRSANLQNADLTGATGLLADQFAHCNVSGAKLPGEIKNFEDSLETLKETSVGAKKIFLTMLLACVYSLLTIFSTGDEKLITNSSSFPLPIIQTGVPIADFYLIAPFILLIIFFYFHLYLQKMWHHLAKLPAVFPDGTPLDDKAYPWLLAQRVRAHFPILQKAGRPPLSHLQGFISILLAWWAVPATIAVFWLWYLRTHDPVYIAFHISFLTVAILSAAHFQRLERNTLRHEPVRYLKDWRKLATYKDIAGRAHRLFAGGVAVAVLALFVSDRAISRAPDHLIPVVLNKIGSRAYLKLTDKNVSTKPPNWARDRALAAIAERSLDPRKKSDGGKTNEKEFELIAGAQLAGKDLSYASAFGAFLVKAKLSRAKLQKANLIDANLWGTDLKRADLRGAKLIGANLSGAKLISTILSDSDLSDADLSGADLRGANLQGAMLRWADLRDTKNLVQKQIDGACVDSTTKLPPHIKRRDSYPACKDWKERKE